TLFGTGTRTGTKARFVSTNPELQYPRLLESMPELVHVTQVNEMLAQERFDVVHDHTTVGPVTAARRKVPTVVPVHSCPPGEVKHTLPRVDDLAPLPGTAPAQPRAAPNLAGKATIHQGMEIAESV